MDDVVKVTVRLPRETHRRVKVRAAAEGVAMEALGRAFFEGYAEGNGLSAGETRRRDGDLGYVEAPEVIGAPSSSAHPDATNLPALAERPFQPDWKKGKK